MWEGQIHIYGTLEIFNNFLKNRDEKELFSIV